MHFAQGLWTSARLGRRGLEAAPLAQLLKLVARHVHLRYDRILLLDCPAPGLITQCIPLRLLITQAAYVGRAQTLGRFTLLVALLLLSVAQWTLSQARWGRLSGETMKVFERAALGLGNTACLSASHVLVLQLVLQSYASAIVSGLAAQADANLVGLLAQILNVLLLGLDAVEDLLAAADPRGGTLLRRLLHASHVH